MNAPVKAGAAAPVRAEPVVALVGNPNAGKSTLFNALTGSNTQVSNYTGTTVDRTEARLRLPGVPHARALDLPGTYSLAARSPEEAIAIDVVLGLDGQAPDVVVAVADAPRLQRSLYLVLQLLELEVPVVVALNLMDEAQAEGCEPDAEALSEVLGVPVIPTVARSGQGLQELREAVVAVLHDPELARPGCPHPWADGLLADAAEVLDALPPDLSAAVAGRPGRARALAMWLLLSVDDEHALSEHPSIPREAVLAVRRRAEAAGRDVEAEIIGQRYAWIDSRVPGLIRSERRDRVLLSDRIDRVLLHPVWGTVVFLAVMAVVFQALFAWSGPAMDLIEGAFAWLGGATGVGFDTLAAAVPFAAGLLGFLRGLFVDGIIGGVGAILVFLPQIGLLFLFIALLEDCGYLARAAHLMDRVLRAAGLPGRAFVPLLSGFACAVPAIMATRTMPRFRDRLLTMTVIPLTSCSARLPVYTLLIAALFPASVAGWPFDMRPTVLFAMYLLSTAVTLVAATVLGRTMMRGDRTPEFIELPPYRLPHPKTVGRTVLSRMGDFVREAGQVILVATVVLWALLHFPQAPDDVLVPPEVAATAQSAEQLEEWRESAAMAHSFGGRMGKIIEPAIRPLGYDWRIGIGIIGSFAAREVFVSTMGVVHGVGEADEEDERLRHQVRTAKRADGSPLYTPLTGLSIMVFFAFAFQCLSTLAVLRRETGGWRWPVFIASYMTVLAWIAAFAVYQGGRLLGFS